MINAQRPTTQLNKSTSPNYAAASAAQPQAPQVTTELSSTLVILLISFRVFEMACS